jgi:DNA excision repair protein ERCC-2
MNRIKNTDAQKLQDEYEKLVSGLQQANDTREDEDMMASPGTVPHLCRSSDLMSSIIERHVR